MNKPLNRRTEEENYKRVDPATLQKVTDRWGITWYIPALYDPAKLVRCYHKDGRRVVEFHRADRYYSQTMLHPLNIAK